MKNQNKNRFKNVYAPIVIFTYNRLSHLKKTIESLKKNKLSKNSDLVIFSDYSKNISEEKKVFKVRNFIKKIKGFNKVTIYERKKNFGLSKNIILGVTKILKQYESIIVIEDDLVFDKFFLNYMNDGLIKFKNNKKIASIHGYIYPVKFKKNVPDYFFLRGADCWGWGTWRSAWKKFNPNGKKLKKLIDKKNLKNEFNFNNSYDYYKMLKDQINGKNNSWAIRWYASAFINEMYTLYPKKTFVKNIGTDGSGTHGSGNINFNKNLGSRKKYSYIKIKKKEIIENIEVKKKIENFFNDNKDSLIIKILKKILK